MARNKDRNAYYTVGIPRDSQTFLKLQQDARDSGITVAKLIALRVSDWYNKSSPNLAYMPVPAASSTEDDIQDMLSDEELDEDNLMMENALAFLEENVSFDLD